MIRRAALALGLIVAASSVDARPMLNGDRPEYAPCIARAAKAFKTSEQIIKVLLDIEGGRVGMESKNTNGSYDLGPMQINDRVWVKHAARFNITRQQLRDDACLNIYTGTWIFMQEFQRVQDLGMAIAHYHSKTGKFQARYLGIAQRAIARRIQHHVAGETVATR